VPTTFAGQSVDATTVLLRFTAAGDANLDGTVDTLDFNSLAAHFGGTGERWSHADFNYDGVVDTLDFNALAANFGKSFPSSSVSTMTIPEPATLCATTLVGALMMMTASRRRRATRV
jgi:hypothetical protein